MGATIHAAHRPAMVSSRRVVCSELAQRRKAGDARNSSAGLTSSHGRFAAQAGGLLDTMASIFLLASSRPAALVFGCVDEPSPLAGGIAASSQSAARAQAAWIIQLRMRASSIASQTAAAVASSSSSSSSSSRQTGSRQLHVAWTLPGTQRYPTHFLSVGPTLAAALLHGVIRCRPRCRSHLNRCA